MTLTDEMILEEINNQIINNPNYILIIIIMLIPIIGGILAVIFSKNKSILPNLLYI